MVMSSQIAHHLISLSANASRYPEPDTKGLRDSPIPGAHCPR